MKEIRFRSILYKAWANVIYDITMVRVLINEFKRNDIQAAKARKQYAELKKVLIIDGDRFTAILAAAQKFNETAFKSWDLKFLDDAYSEFVAFFER